MFAHHLILEPMIKYCQLISDHAKSLLPNEKDINKYRQQNQNSVLGIFSKKNADMDELLRFKFFDFFEYIIQILFRGDQLEEENYAQIVQSLCVHLNDLHFCRVELYDKVDIVKNLNVDDAAV